MSGTLVTYNTPLPTGMSLVVLNTHVVELNISSAWTGYADFLAATHKSVLTSVLDKDLKPIRVLHNDEDCLVDDVKTGAKKIRDFEITGLVYPDTHTVRFSITYGAVVLNYQAEVIVLGPMDLPEVTRAVISHTDARTAIITVTPHKLDGKSHADLTADIQTVTITAISKEDTHVRSFTLAENGQYSFPLLTIGSTYKFFVEMTNTTGNKVVPASEKDGNISLYMIDATAFDANRFLVSVDKDVLFVTIPAYETADVAGTEAFAAPRRPLLLSLLTAVVPADRLDAATYVPADGEWAATTYPFGIYDAKLKVTPFAGSTFSIPNMYGRTLKFRAAITNSNGQSRFCEIQSGSVAANTTIDASGPVVEGLQLVGYEYRVVSDDTKSELNSIGEWSCDNELIIAGSKTANSITLSAFDGISSNGANIEPTVTLRTPVISFVHAKLSSPFYRIAQRAVYAKMGDFTWTDFTAKDAKFKRSDLALDGANLKIASKQWLAMAKADIKSEVSHSAIQVAVCTLAACAQPSVTVSLAADGSNPVATFTVTEIQSHKTFVGKANFTDDKAGVLNYHIINLANGVETLVSRDLDGNLVKCVLPIVQGSSRNYYSIVARASKGDLIGASPVLRVDDLPIIPGLGRTLVGMYACGANAIASGVLAHSAGVGASFAIAYDGRFSVDQKVADFTADASHAMDYQMSGVQSYDAIQAKWTDVANATVSGESRTDADSKQKYAYFRVTNVTGLKLHRVQLARQYKLTDTPATKIVDQLPVYINFIPTINPVTPAFTASGSDGQVNVVFANGSSAESQVVIDSGLRNDLLLQDGAGKMNVVRSSTEAEFVHADLAGSVVAVAGARSYANPNAHNGLLMLADDARVSSDATALVSANITAGPAKLANVSVATVFTPEVKADATVTPAIAYAAAFYRTVFMCDAPASEVSAEVVVYYDAAGVINDISKSYPLSKDAKTGKFSAAVDPVVLQGHLGLTAEKFLLSNLKCVFTASAEYAAIAGKDTRRSQPSTVFYTPDMKPTLAATDFKVEKLAGALRVYTQGQSVEQLGGNSYLNVKLVATAGSVSGNTFTPSASKLVYSESVVLTSDALSHSINNMAAGLYQLSVVIQKSDLVAETSLIIGTFKPDAALVAAKTFTVNAASVTSLAASWTNLTIDELAGWVVDSRKLYVSSIDAGVTTWYTAAAGTKSDKTAFQSSSALSETLSGLPTGKQLTVSLETTYTKTGESPQMAHMDTQVICAAAPQFSNLSYDAASGIVTALVNQNGSFLTNFWLFARYSGAQGQIYFNVDLANLNAKSQNNTNCLFKITMPASGPKPTGIMGILVNAHGAVANGHPAGTFGAPAGGNATYNSQTDASITVNL